MKGYNTPSGYMGYVGGRYILFCCEDENCLYNHEYIKEQRTAA